MGKHSPDGFSAVPGIAKTTTVVETNQKSQILVIVTFVVGGRLWSVTGHFRLRAPRSANHRPVLASAKDEEQKVGHGVL